MVAAHDEVVDGAQGREAGAYDADAILCHGPYCGFGIGPWEKGKGVGWLAFSGLSGMDGFVYRGGLTGCVWEREAV